VNEELRRKMDAAVGTPDPEDRSEERKARQEFLDQLIATVHETEPPRDYQEAVERIMRVDLRRIEMLDDYPLLALLQPGKLEWLGGFYVALAIYHLDPERTAKIAAKMLPARDVERLVSDDRMDVLNSMPLAIATVLKALLERADG
jgi:hypothetical protein